MTARNPSRELPHPANERVGLWVVVTVLAGFFYPVWAGFQTPWLAATVTPAICTCGVWISLRLWPASWSRRALVALALSLWLAMLVTWLHDTFLIPRA